MLRLMKYEYRKTLTSKLIFLGVLALGELFFLANHSAHTGPGKCFKQNYGGANFTS